MREKFNVSITENSAFVDSGSTGSLSRVRIPSFLDYQLSRKGFSKDIIEKISETFPEVESFGELMGVLE